MKAICVIGYLRRRKTEWQNWRKFANKLTKRYMELDKDLKEFIELLNEHKVSYLVIGGYAVNYHGYPRYTN